MRLATPFHRKCIGEAVLRPRNQILWIFYGEPLHHGSHSYGRKPSYRSKERFMLELLVLIVALAACCLLLVYDHLRSRL